MTESYYGDPPGVETGIGPTLDGDEMSNTLNSTGLISLSTGGAGCITTGTTAGTYIVCTASSAQYSHPSAEEVHAILARHKADLQLALAGDKAAAERYRYRGIESVRQPRGGVAKVSHTTFLPSNHDLVAKGERILDRIWLWREVPLLGPIVTSRLADQLDRLTDALTHRLEMLSRTATEGT